ncbi:hypothetical protein [Bacteroides sp. 14(A)]|uniref:hypothetical protein n=1 Tax=Bacteroides sp. 14(A) TaxID=1163670 RepID=UPI00047867BF|nr:hypothetical protein [Bacteroides sp. 14(A)]
MKTQKRTITSIEEGALVLLGESTKILNDNEMEYLIVGGWSPFLLNSGVIPHPGTRDVDILFKSGRKIGELESIIRIFLENGFLQSAKHTFQLLKPIEINGQDYVFNIDLLHPGEMHQSEPEMFVDHIDFPILESHSMKIPYKGGTILLPNSDFFFDHFNLKFEKEFEYQNGEKEHIEFNLINEAGLILSKIKSAFSVKRRRDAFDIFLALYQSNDYEKTISQIKEISLSHSDVLSALKEMNTPEKIEKLDDNILHWLYKIDSQLGEKDWAIEELESIGRDTLVKFFHDLKI